MLLRGADTAWGGLSSGVAVRGGGAQPLATPQTPISCPPQTAQRKIREIVQQVKQQEHKHAQGAAASQHSK